MALLSGKVRRAGLFDDVESVGEGGVAAACSTTNGNFRLTSRLVAQIRRIMEINQIRTLTSEVVDAARESLVIGVI